MPKFYGQNKKRIDPRYFLDEKTEEVDEGRDIMHTRFGKSLVPGKQVVVNLSGEPGAEEVAAIVVSEPDPSTGMIDLKIAGPNGPETVVVSTDRVWEPEPSDDPRASVGGPDPDPDDPMASVGGPDPGY